MAAALGVRGGDDGCCAALSTFGVLSGRDESGVGDFGAGGHCGSAGVHCFVRGVGAGGIVVLDGVAGFGLTGAILFGYVRQRTSFRGFVGLDPLCYRTCFGGGDMLRYLALPGTSASRSACRKNGAPVSGSLVRSMGLVRSLRWSPYTGHRFRCDLLRRRTNSDAFRSFHGRFDTRHPAPNLPLLLSGPTRTRIRRPLPSNVLSRSIRSTSLDNSPTLEIQKPHLSH